MTHPRDKKIPLVEKFGPTIQGEGATIGLQTFFLRFGLCDYMCTMCDSMHAVDPLQVKKNALWLTQDQIAELFLADTQLLRPLGPQWITLSGGNPCIHDLSHLVTVLKSWGFKLAVETQGTFCPKWLNECDIITVSPKGPGMGEIFEPDKYEHFIRTMINAHKSVNTKVVIFNEADLKFAEDVAYIWMGLGYTMDGFYLSQGNPFPPGKGAPIGSDLHVNILRDEYLKLFDKIRQSTWLSKAKWLPQWHVILWGNRQGV